MNILKRYGPQLHVEQYTGEQQKKKHGFIIN